MKRSLLLLMACLVLLSACCAPPVMELPAPGLYSRGGKGDIPRLQLTQDRRFTLEYAALSSYVPQGTYEMQEDLLVLTTGDDYKYVYVFSVEREGLVFLARQSSTLYAYPGGLADKDKLVKDPPPSL